MAVAMNTLPILYSFRRCPYAIRARLALCQAGVPVELREVDLKRKPPALLAVSSAATVPVLDAGPGAVLVHSLDIMRWALAQSDGDRWLARGDAGLNQRLVDTNDGDFKHALDRYKYANRHPLRSQAAYRDEAAFLEGLSSLGGTTEEAGRSEFAALVVSLSDCPQEIPRHCAMSCGPEDAVTHRCIAKARTRHESVSSPASPPTRSPA